MKNRSNYIRYGDLPFVGRDKESSRLLEFCRLAPMTSGLRCLLLSGEAGIGKTRLLNETLPTLVEEQCVVLRLKVLPENCHDMIAPLTSALRENGEVRELIRIDLDGSVTSVMTALRQLTHLRITVLVIENFHAIQGECVKILSGFLDSFSDEPLTVLFVSRPVDKTILQSFQPYIVDEIALSTLEARDLGTVWQELFNISAPEALIPILQEMSNGNPKALRAVLSEAVTKGLILRDDGVVSSEEPAKAAEPMKLAVFGGFTFFESNGKQKNLGQRIAKVFAVMAAQSMMKKPLGFPEFCRIASDGEEDSERARNIVYIALHRLRKELGEDAITTFEHVPNLNTALVRVDMSEANERLESAFESLKSGMLMRAVFEVKAVLTLWDGATPFAGFYDSFFESVRDEFEFKISSAVIKVGKALLEQSDISQAHSILEQAYVLLKDDEAIADLYRKALSKAGEFMELHAVAQAS